jgi:PelA/Pel-15E family pectate lyase
VIREEVVNWGYCNLERGIHAASGSGKSRPVRRGIGASGRPRREQLCCWVGLAPQWDLSPVEVGSLGNRARNVGWARKRAEARAPSRLCLYLRFALCLVLTAGGLTVANASALEHAKESDDWFRSAEGRRLVETVITWQTPRGNWPKSIDTTLKVFTGNASGLTGTFDNGATTGELLLLGRAAQATGNSNYVQAYLRGLDHILAAQYPTGGWPQFYPPGTNYSRYITFNDHVMVRILEVLWQAAGATNYTFLDPSRREAAKKSFDRGIECILNCQVIHEGQPTVWGAQHDEVTLEPRPARAFELASLSGAESTLILRLLMRLENPNPRIIRAIRGGVAWFEASKLTGIRQVTRDGEKLIVADDQAPPLWARFYEIPTQRPIFAGRDGKKKYQLSEIEAERRLGYSWYGEWGNSVLADYARWTIKHAPPETKAGK